MIYLAIGLSVFLMARGEIRGDMPTAESGAVLLILSALMAVLGG